VHSVEVRQKARFVVAGEDKPPTLFGLAHRLDPDGAAGSTG
jgi:hypothetical protein